WAFGGATSIKVTNMFFSRGGSAQTFKKAVICGPGQSTRISHGIDRLHLPRPITHRRSLAQLVKPPPAGGITPRPARAPCNVGREFLQARRGLCWRHYACRRNEVELGGGSGGRRPGRRRCVGHCNASIWRKTF